MKISFQFDHSARRLQLEPETELEKFYMKEFAETAAKGTALKLVASPDQFKDSDGIYEVVLRINGFEKERAGG